LQCQHDAPKTFGTARLAEEDIPRFEKLAEDVGCIRGCACRLHNPLWCKTAAPNTLQVTSDGWAIPMENGKGSNGRDAFANELVYRIRLSSGCLHVSK
jgi:hypothetical protein